MTFEYCNVIIQSQLNGKTCLGTEHIKDYSVRLQKCYQVLVDDLYSAEIIDKLVEDDVLRLECIEELKSCLTPQDKNRKLLRKLIFKYNDGYDKFLCALRDDHVNKDLAERIENTKVTQQDIHLLRIASIQKVLTEVRSKISKGDLDKIRTGSDLIKIVENKKIASDCKYIGLVKEFIQTSSYTGIQRIISFDDIQTDSKTDVDEMSKEEHFDITCMKVVDNFTKTVQYLEMVEKIEKNRIVLVRGPNGSGKSQYSFAYANEFSSRFPSATIWRIPCRSAQSMNMSLSILMSRLKIDGGRIHIKGGSYSCFQTTIKTVIVRMSDMNDTNHLIILDDVESPEIPVIDSLLKMVSETKNIYVIGTSNKRFSINHYRKYGMEMNRMTEDEAFLFFEFADHSREDVSTLARKLDFLPLALSFAATYIENTQTSIEKYIQLLENDKLSENDLGAHLLFQPFNLILQRLQNDLSVKVQCVLTYASYFVNDNIPVMLLKSLLPDFLSEGEKEAEINNLIIALSKYSVAVVKGYGERRNISIHSMTCLAIRKNKTQGQIKQEIYDLLKHYCFLMDLDLRLVESMKRNICFLSHATLLIEKFQSYFDRNSFQMKVYESYLCCAIGVTFRIYGNAELSSNYYLEHAKSIIFEMINFHPNISSYPFTSSDPMLHLKGCNILQQDTKIVFHKLIQKCDHNMSGDFVQTFLANKFRSSSEIELFVKYANGKIDRRDVKHFKLTSRNINRRGNLKKVFAPFKSTRETFLVELLISIMHESSKNKWWMESTNSMVTKYSNDATRMDSLTDSQFSYNIADLLQRYLYEKYEHFSPIAALVEQRDGMIGFLRSEKTISTKSLHKIIHLLKKLEEKGSSTLFYTYGVLKMAPDFTLYHKCMINRALLKCCIINWQKIKNQECLERAISQAETLNNIALEMKDNWLICMSIYLEIAETYLLYPTKKNISQAKQNYKMAFELQSKFGGILLTTEYHFNLYQQYIKFCLDFGNFKDLTVARKISVEMRERCVQQERKQAIGNNLIKIEERRISNVSLDTNII
ncbi:unnamed protein product [Mytilus coruscus]|uniref:CARD domain-containing protein n=1 Tax=Mytilus coruscus TaxID=42192 RepID=A0A6J8DWJ4_MYTCO|nr:unnamed protein product [Mytilus coruscus]